LIDNFKKQIELKKETYSVSESSSFSGYPRGTIHSIAHSTAVKKTLVSLKKENTFTITTGHQLSLMTGPLYFLYKIISTINLV